MTATPAIARLERAAAVLRVSDVAGVREVGAGMTAWLSLDATTMDQALGLARGRGGQGPRHAAGKALRDQFLREAAIRFDLDAKALATALQAYVTRGGWSTDQTATECPKHLKEARRFYWHALKSWPRPIRERQIANILTST